MDALGACLPSANIDGRAVLWKVGRYDRQTGDGEGVAHS
jgi:hypothetical protein